MKLKDRIKTYNFWVSLASAVILLINTLGKQFNFSVDESLYNDLFTSFCGILVLLGIIVPPSTSNRIQTEKQFNEIIQHKQRDKKESSLLQNNENNILIFKDDSADCKNNLQDSNIYQESCEDKLEEIIKKDENKI